MKKLTPALALTAILALTTIACGDRHNEPAAPAEPPAAATTSPDATTDVTTTDATTDATTTDGTTVTTTTVETSTTTDATSAPATTSQP